MIDGVAVAVKFIEALVGLGLGTSKKGDLALPIAKAYRGELGYLASAYWRQDGRSAGPA